MNKDKQNTAGDILREKFPKTLEILEETVKKDMSLEERQEVAKKCETVFKPFVDYE